MIPRRVRRGWRFRLSTLFVATALICLGLAYTFHREPLTVKNIGELQERQKIELDLFRVIWNQDGSRVAFHGWETPVEVRDSVTLWKLKTIGQDKKIISFAF